MSEDESSGPSATGLFLGIASLGAGAYHGYCDAQGIVFEKENLETVLTYGPTVVQGVLGAIVPGLVGLVAGGVVGADSRYSNRLIAKAAKGAGGAVLGAAAGAAVGGAIGSVKGGVQTLIGYGVGYLAGYALR